uniref:DDE Tnp4 domain-containing protein n=1 Tax=Trichogramma kaykai TaxID=54128 RepID=A0ABD2VV31_9HYME
MSPRNVACVAANSEPQAQLEEDMKNFIQYKIFGASHLKLKPDVVPHNFACQPERANNSTELNITAFKKLNRKRLLSDILKENNQDSCNIKKPFTNEGSASKLPFSEFSPTEHFQSEFSHSDCADSAQNETALFTVSNAENAFEIRILKPTDPVHQSLTWSEYKKCNTSKYLVAVTCDGMIAYISQGYSGRISDVLLFEKCGITQILPEGCGILADRGYKQIDKILNQFKCKLIRPPSVSSTVKPSKSEGFMLKKS